MKKGAAITEIDLQFTIICLWLVYVQKNFQKIILKVLTAISFYSLKAINLPT